MDQLLIQRKQQTSLNLQWFAARLKPELLSGLLKRLSLSSTRESFSEIITSTSPKRLYIIKCILFAYINRIISVINFVAMILDRVVREPVVKAFKKSWLKRRRVLRKLRKRIRFCLSLSKASHKSLELLRKS